MIAADTSTLIAYLAGDSGDDVAILDQALKDRQVCLPPVVLTELLSAPKLTAKLSRLFRELPYLQVTQGYWQRAGALRASVLDRKYKARLADTLIAQSCLDHKVPLTTRDGDFQNFVRVSALQLLP